MFWLLKVKLRLLWQEYLNILAFEMNDILDKYNNFEVYENVALSNMFTKAGHCDFNITLELVASMIFAYCLYQKLRSLHIYYTTRLICGFKTN